MMQETTQTAIEYFEGCVEKSKRVRDYRLPKMDVVFRIDRPIKELSEISPLTVLGERIDFIAWDNATADEKEIYNEYIQGGLYKIAIRVVSDAPNEIYFRVIFYCIRKNDDILSFSTRPDFCYEKLSASDAAIYCNHLLSKGYKPLDQVNQLVNIVLPPRQKSARK